MDKIILQGYIKIAIALGIAFVFVSLLQTVLIIITLDITISNTEQIGRCWVSGMVVTIVPFIILLYIFKSLGED